MSDWDNKIVFTFPFAMNLWVCVCVEMPLILVLALCILCWRGGCDTLSEGVSIKYKFNLGFDDQPAAQAITSRTMGCNLQTSTLNTLQNPDLNFDLLFCFLLRGWYAHCCWYAQLLFSSSQTIMFSSSWMICPTLNTSLETNDSCWYAKFNFLSDGISDTWSSIMLILNITTLCCLCVVANEIREYVLISCVYCREVWKLILLRLDPVCNLFSSWPQLLSWLRQGSAAAPKTMRTVVAQAAIFLLWRQRNNFLHNQQSIKVISLFRVINQKCVTGFLFSFSVESTALFCTGFLFFLYFCHGVQLD